MNPDSRPSGHLLLLAGSGESRVLAQRLAAPGKMQVTASLLYPPRSFGPLPVQTRIGGFDGPAGLMRFLQDQNITAVLDATHPFAARISQRVVQVCTDLGLPHAQVLRPEWQPGAGDHWQSVCNEAAAAVLLSAGQRVFTTTGRATLAALVSHSPAQFFARRIEMQPEKPDHCPDHDNVTYVSGKGPFSVADEILTLRDLNIDVLVVKNSGGVPSRTKLDAARAIGIRVVLIERPPLLQVTRLETVQSALDWIEAL